VHADALAGEIAQRCPHRPWTVPWAHWRTDAEHCIAGRHSGPVRAVAVGELDGRAIAVTGSDDQTLRVRDLSGSELAVVELGSRTLAMHMLGPTILVAADAGAMTIQPTPTSLPGTKLTRR
jgi:ABC-type nitrate/sulfonate/bicarbonate transport system substrate-binding protein